jgi:FAD/FMN-containing dehydrogenase
MKRRAFLQSAAAAAALFSLPRNHALAEVLRTDAIPPRSSLDAVTGDGKEVTLSPRALADLRARLRGRLLLAQDDGYDDARRILNPSFDRHPALVVQPAGVSDISAAVQFAAEHGGLLLAVKCGGHSYSGQSTCDRGMQIDLSQFRHVRVEPGSRTAWAAGGSLLGEIDHEIMAHDLATPLGTVSHTGVGGLVTGGGFGRLARRYGLAIDNVKSVQVVTADGRLQRADAEENPELFWGVRGGGGNFGIVTSFEFALHPMRREVFGGRLVFPISKAREALTLFADYIPEAPDELSLDFVMAQPPGEQPGVVLFDVCYSGPESGLEEALAPLKSLGTPLADGVKPVDYRALQKSGDSDDPRSEGLYLKGGFIPRLGPELVTAIVDGFRPDPRRSTVLFFQPGGGAIARVPVESTAFPHRDIFANMLVLNGWRFGEDATDHIQAARDHWKQLERFTYGFYVNDLLPDASAAAIQANYRQNLQRLVKVKNQFDPTNLFRMNANIPPTV